MLKDVINKFRITGDVLKYPPNIKQIILFQAINYKKNVFKSVVCNLLQVIMWAGGGLSESRGWGGWKPKLVQNS